MNYNSVEEIFAAGTTNMTVLRNNNKQDDGVDTVTGVDWFTFNGTTASTIYASGNSFTGFGSNSEHLKVNRRDSALYSLYREEGTLHNYYKFLKIRWSGYSIYSSTATACEIEYDVILWDTGDISLHMISIPTTYNNGVYSLVAGSTYNYTVTSSEPDVTFKKTSNGFTVINSIIKLMPPFEKRFLLRSGSTIYTVIDNALTALTDTTLSANTFLAHGMETFPTTVSLAALEDNIDILCWWETSEYGVPTGITIKGLPPVPQIITAELGNTIENKIKKVMSDCSADVLFTISYDGGTTKYYYNGTEWVVADSTTVGMTNSILEGLDADKWAALNNNDAPITLYGAISAANSYFRSVGINYV